MKGTQKRFEVPLLKKTCPLMPSMSTFYSFGDIPCSDCHLRFFHNFWGFNFENLEAQFFIRMSPKDQKLGSSMGLPETLWIEGQDHLPHHLYCRGGPIPFKLIGLPPLEKGSDQTLPRPKSLYRQTDRYWDPGSEDYGSPAPNSTGGGRMVVKPSQFDGNRRLSFFSKRMGIDRLHLQVEYS